MSGSPAERDGLLARVHDWISNAYGEDSPQGPLPSSVSKRKDFERLLLEVIQYQQRNNKAYRRYLKKLGVSQIEDPFLAPPVPTDAFKRATLTTFDAEEATVCFRSSGTTLHERGRHYLRDLKIARRSIEAPFRRFMLPDRAKIKMLILAPKSSEAPESSLYFMFDHLQKCFGTEDSEHFIDPIRGLDVERLFAVMQRAEAANEPVMLLAPSFGYVHLLDGLGERRCKLPKGSRLFETGGFKGKSRVIPRLDLHRALLQSLGLEPQMIAGEYGMSELSSQLYENSIRQHSLSLATTPRLYHPPPWCAVQILDPTSLSPLPLGEVGMVAFLDLANVETVSSILTGDLGRLHSGEDTEGWSGLPEGSCGLELLGRASSETQKGCSLAVDMLLGSP